MTSYWWFVVTMSIVYVAWPKFAIVSWPTCSRMHLASWLRVISSELHQFVRCKWIIFVKRLGKFGGMFNSGTRRYTRTWWIDGQMDSRENEATVDIKLCPRFPICCHCICIRRQSQTAWRRLVNTLKMLTTSARRQRQHCQCHAPPAHWKTWRYPPNRKYITYSIVVRGGQSHGPE